MDDHEILRHGLKEIFAEAFPIMEVGEAANSREALDMALTQDWDIILLEISIPGHGGLVVLEEIKRLRPHIPVLVWTAYAEEEFAMRSLKLGGYGFVNKTQTSMEGVAAAKKVMSGGKYVT